MATISYQQTASVCYQEPPRWCGAHSWFMIIASPRWGLCSQREVRSERSTRPLHLTFQNCLQGAMHLNKHAKEGDTPLLAAAWNQNWEVNFCCHIPKLYIVCRSNISKGRIAHELMPAYPGHGCFSRGRRWRKPSTYHTYYFSAWSRLFSTANVGRRKQRSHRPDDCERAFSCAHSTIIGTPLPLARQQMWRTRTHQAATRCWRDFNFQRKNCLGLLTGRMMGWHLRTGVSVCIQPTTR